MSTRLKVSKYKNLHIGKVVLVIPNFRWVKDWTEKTLWEVFPYNLCLIAAMIEDKYDVKIIDATIDNMSMNEFATVLQNENPEVVGISVLTNEYGETGHIAAKIIKQIDERIIIVFGGVYATVSAEFIIKDNNIDYIVVGEGEYVFRNLLDYIYGRSETRPMMGIVYKEGRKEVFTGRADFINNLDDLPFPAYRKIDFMKYAYRIPRESVDSPRELPYVRILTSRGCPIGCCFCEVEHISGKKFRYRSPENVVDEMEWLRKTYGIKSILFDDDNLCLNKKRANAIFKKMIERRLNLKWNAIAMSVYTLDDEMLELMKESGCQFIDIAIESGVERVLKEIIKKPVDLDHARKMIKKAKDLNIDLSANFIIGFPGETWSEIRQTIKFAEDIDIDYVKIFIATPLPKTKLYEMAKSGGYLKDGFDFGKHCWSYGQFRTDEFTPEDLAVLRAYEWDRINFSSSQKRKKIAKMMDVTEERLNQIIRNTLASVHSAIRHRGSSSKISC